VRTLPGRPALDTDEGVKAGITTRIVMATTAVFGQLWALSAGLDRYLLGYTTEAWLLAGLSALSFLVVLAVTLVRPAPRREEPGRGRASTQAAGLYQPRPAGRHEPVGDRAAVPSGRPQRT
jgi:hypothetical protein